MTLSLSQSHVLNLKFLRESTKQEQRGLDYTYFIFQKNRGEKCSVPSTEPSITEWKITSTLILHVILQSTVFNVPIRDFLSNVSSIIGVF